MNFEKKAMDSYHVAIEYLKQFREGDEFSINNFMRWTIKSEFLGRQVAIRIAERLKIEGYITDYSYNDRKILKVPS